MSSQVSLVVLLSAVVGSTALVGKTVYDRVADATSIYYPTNRAGVTLVTHNSKKELTHAMRRQGIELGSSDTEYTLKNLNGCFYHVVGKPTEEKMQLARELCEQ